MADSQSPRDIDHAITTIKRGAYLLKYGRRGKPKFCPFRLSTDEFTLLWNFGKDERQLDLRRISKIIPGQRTPIFKRYPRPEKEYQSFSLIYAERSLDLICKDKEETDIWFVALKALIERNSYWKSRNESKSEFPSSESSHGQKVTPFSLYHQGDTPRNKNIPINRLGLGKVFADIGTYTGGTGKTLQLPDPIAYPPHSVQPPALAENIVNISQTPVLQLTDQTLRASLSSAVSSSSQGSCIEDFNTLGDVFIWGEGTGEEGGLGGGLVNKFNASSSYNGNKIDSHFPKVLDSTIVVNVNNISCGYKHAILLTKHGEIFSWGEDSGGRLGHGVEADIPHPKLIENLSGIEMVACGKYHTCAVTVSGDLYTWGDGSINSCFLGHGSEASHWIPKKVVGPIDGLQVSFVTCGLWHTALLTSTGELYTFGEGCFGALGHGDRHDAFTPRQVEALKEYRTSSVSCGIWHTAAVVEMSIILSGKSDPSLIGKIFTWGDGDEGRLGHGDTETKLVPEFVASLADENFSNVACATDFTVALTVTGRVYTFGSTNGKTPTCLEGFFGTAKYVEDIACGSHHIAILTSKAEVYTWGKGANGQLGHGDNDDRDTPTLVEFLKDKLVKSIACGSNFTAVICLHKCISTADNSMCSGCNNVFNFRRKRHNCYNCGLVFCKACSCKKSMKASLAPSAKKRFRVCDSCFAKLKKNVACAGSLAPRLPKAKSSPSDLTEVASSSIQISRIPSSDSFKSERSVKSEPNDTNRVFAIQTAATNNHLARTSAKLLFNHCGNSKNFLSFSVANARISSWSPSPVLGKSGIPSPSSPFCRSDASPHAVKDGNDSLSQEVRSLRAQVEELASKSQILEAELERRSKQLQVATAQAADEAEKSKEVIKTLTCQLKEMSERERERVVHVDTSNNKRYSNGGGDGSRITSLNIEHTDSPPVLSYGNKSLIQKSERIIQDEPGVYITLSSLPNGANELRRVRFSRKHFTEEQAEKWWAEYGTGVCERYNIQTVE